MCGRFSRYTGSDVLINHYGIDSAPPNISASYNIAPNQNVLTVYQENPIILTEMRWGFLPPWAKSHDAKPSPINARNDSLSKNMYKHSFQSRRCLIPADGFYEWKKLDGMKQPYYIQLVDEEIMSLGGIYSIYRDEAQSKEIKSFAIITTPPNDLMKSIHDRMPLIIPPGKEKIWLDSSSDMNEVEELVKPYPREMRSYPVSKYVNSPKNNSEECIVPIDENKVGLEENQSQLDDYF